MAASERGGAQLEKIWSTLETGWRHMGHSGSALDVSRASPQGLQTGMYEVETGSRVARQRSTSQWRAAEQE